MKKFSGFRLKKLAYGVIWGCIAGGCITGASISSAQSSKEDEKGKDIGDIKVWDCDCAHSGRTCERDHERAAIQLAERLSQLSSVYWKMGLITTSPDFAAFSIGVHEGSRVPEISEILAIARGIGECGELITRHTFKPQP